MNIIKYILLAVFMAWCGVAQATTYTVCASGCDYATLAAARAGTYAQGDTLKICDALTGYFSFKVGTYGLTMTGICPEKTNGSINGLAEDNALIVRGQSNTISDLTIYGSLASVVYVYSTATNNVFSGLNISGGKQDGFQVYGNNNIITDSQIYGNGDSTGDGGIYDYGVGNEYSYNDIYNNNTSSGGQGITLMTTSDGVKVHHNNVWGNGSSSDGTAIEGYGSENGLIYKNLLGNSYNIVELKYGFNNNLIYDNILYGATSGQTTMLVGEEIGVESTGNEFYNNTIIANNSTNGHGLYLTSSGNIFKNNIFTNVKSGSFSIKVEDIESGFGTLNYNLYDTTNSSNIIQNADNSTVYTLANWRTFSSQDANSVASNPLLDSNYRPVGASPAINAGTPLAQVTDDIVGTRRPWGIEVDIGAYETQTGITVR